MRVLSRLLMSVCVIALLMTFAGGVATAQSRGFGASPRISLDLQDAQLKSVLKLFSQQAGMNFIASERIQDRNITVYMEDVPVEDALDNLMKANGLVFEKAQGSEVYVVREWVQEEVETITRIYTLSYARVSTSAIGRSTGKMGEAQEEIVGSESFFGSMSSSGSRGGSSGAQQEPQGIDKIIGSLLSRHGSLVADPRTNSLVITDIEANFEKIEDMIAKLDTPTPQVMIQAEILETTNTALEQLGLEYPETLMTFSGAARTTAAPMSALFPKTLRDSSTISLGSIATTPIEAIAMQALRTHTDTQILARPRVLTLNNEPAVIRIVADTAIGRKVSTTSAVAGTSTEEAERTDTGIALTVTPQVNKDRDVTMFIEPSVSRPIDSEFFPGVFVDPQTRSVSTVVRVKDGETVVIGGLIQTIEENTLSKVPILGDVPIMGALFRHKDDALVDKELIVFITPHIPGADRTQDDEVDRIADEVLGKGREQPAPLDRHQAIDSELRLMEARTQ
ncbi:MAG: hypothetical protein JW937_10610 [Candidatus Omnitrophica bacterium]|nr:hypothetical protein [Candidatus Omnitrophota bacterium]